MMMNEQSLKDLNNYRRISIRTSLVMVGLLLTATMLAWWWGLLWLLKPLLGAVVGSVLASLNMFALAYAFLVLVINNGSRWVLLWPIILFLSMCAAALVIALYQPDLLLGFALGLSTPLMIGAMITLDKPA